MLKSFVDYRWLPSLLIVVVLLSRCGPTLVNYEHLVVDENSKLEVIERSTASNSSQGDPLSGQKTDLPTKCILKGNGYVVTIDIPTNPFPVVFLRIVNENEEELSIRGAYLRDLDESSGAGIDGFQYSFIVDDADGDAIEFDVLGEQGVVLGHEKISYKVVSRGFAWAIDSI